MNYGLARLFGPAELLVKSIARNCDLSRPYLGGMGWGLSLWGLIVSMISCS